MGAQRTNFTQAEISEFRDIFNFWVEKSASLKRASQLPSEIEPDEQPTLMTMLSKDGADDLTRKQFLSMDGMQRIVRSLGLPMNHDEKKVLHDRIYSLPRVDPDK